VKGFELSEALGVSPSQLALHDFGYGEGVASSVIGGKQ
jgi:hypothetical protein